MKKAILFLWLALIAPAALFAQTTTPASQPAIPFLGSRATDPNCSRKGNLYYNITSHEYKVCTATGTPGTWGALGGGGGGEDLNFLTDTYPGSGSQTQDFHLVDPAYVPFGGLITVDNPFSVSSTDNIQNNLGVINTSNHFTTAIFDMKVNAVGADKLYTGIFNQLRVTGTTYSGTPNIRGIWNQVNNRTNLLATPNIYGIDSAVSVEGHANEAVGAQMYVFKGSAVNALKLVGFRTIAANSYTNADSVTGVDADVRSINPGFAPTTTLMRGVWSHMSQASGTITTLNGIEVSGWTQTGGTVGTASAIKIANDTQVGSTNYAIQSLSTAPSVFSGTVTVPADAYASGWNGSNQVPTKNDVYDKIEALPTPQTDNTGLGIFGFPNFANLGTRTRLTGVAASGNNDVYTVPAGYQFLVRNFYEWGNAAGYSVYHGVKISASYYRLTNVGTVAANQSRADVYPIVYEAGETIFINSSAANVRYMVDGYLIANSKANFVRPMITSTTAATDTLLYTVPTGKSAISIMPVNGQMFTSGGVLCTNDTGTNATLTGGFVPSGSAIDSTYYTQVNLTMNTASVGQLSVFPSSMSDGDKMYIQSSQTHSPVCYTTILEY